MNHLKKYFAMFKNRLIWVCGRFSSLLKITYVHIRRIEQYLLASSRLLLLLLLRAQCLWTNTNGLNRYVCVYACGCYLDILFKKIKISFGVSNIRYTANTYSYMKMASRQTRHLYLIFSRISSIFLSLFFRINFPWANVLIVAAHSHLISDCSKHSYFFFSSGD